MMAQPHAKLTGAGPIAERQQTAIAAPMVLTVWPIRPNLLTIM